MLFFFLNISCLSRLYNSFDTRCRRFFFQFDINFSAKGNANITTERITTIKTKKGSVVLRNWQKLRSVSFWISQQKHQLGCWSWEINQG